MRRWFAFPLALALTVWGCGNSGSSTADASGPDAPASVDAATSPDAGGGPGGDAGSGSPYQLIPTCQTSDAGVADGGGLDAAPFTGPAAAADAAPTDAAAVAADAGGPPGTGDPCCSPDMECGTGLACIQGPNGRTCRPTCDLKTGACPPGGLCANFGGQGVCIPAQTEGQQCDPELCDAKTICVGTSASNAVCRRRCTSQNDCDSGQTCTPIPGANAMACLPN